CDIVRGEAMRALQVECRLDCRLCPTAHRVRLEVLLADPPATAEVAPERSCIVAFDGQRRRAGEAIAREQRRGEPDVRAPARTVLHHRWRFAGAQYLATRAERFRDTQRMPGSRRVTCTQPRHHCR